MRSKYVLLLICCFMSCGPTTAQTGPYLQVYQLDAAEARSLYQQKTTDIPATFFHTPIRTFTLAANASLTPAQQDSLPFGHFLLVQARGEAVDIQLHSRYTHSVQLLKHEQDLLLQVFDSLGQTKRDVRVRFRGEELHYNPELTCFQLKKTHRDGLLEVIGETETLFYSVDNTLRNSLCTRRWRRFTSTKVGYYLTSPYRWVINSYGYLQRGVRWGDWQMRRPLFRGRHKPLKGYIAFSQPKYRPADTLRIKAFVTKHNGKPWKKPLQLSIQPYGTQAVLEQSIRPQEPGVFVLDWTLPDSLVLDKMYGVTLSSPRKERFGNLRHQFRYEDYELAEVSYQLRSTQNRYRQGEPIVFTATGTDQNGLPVPDGQIRLILQTQRIDEYYTPELWVPDTLWQYTGPLHPPTETRITVPNDIFPPADMRIRATAYFTNSSGELQQKDVYFQYAHQKRGLSLHIDAAYLVAHALVGQDTLTNQVATLSAFSKHIASGVTETRVTLPYRTKIDPKVERYRLFMDSLTTELVPFATDAKVLIDGVIRQDTVHCRIDNPRKIPIQWWVMQQDKAIASGVTTDRLMQWKKPDNGKAPYRFRIHYVWGGQSKVAAQEVVNYKNLLSLTVQTPDKIEPGATTSLTITATDYRGKPAPGVHLAVGAINAQFGRVDNFSATKIPYRAPRDPLRYHNYQLKRNDNKTFRQAMHTRWYRQLALDSMVFYQMRYQNDGFFAYADTVQGDTFYRRVAQFSPFLMSKGKAVPIYSIHCNGNLVYYHGTTHRASYSFIGQAGYNRIALRTKTGTFTLDSLLLQTGQRLVFALDLDRWPQSTYQRNISFAAQKPEWTQQERQQLQQSILSLRELTANRLVRVWDGYQGVQSYHGSWGSKRIRLGPFRPGSQLHYQEVGFFQKKLTFDADYTYIITEAQERLHAYDLFPTKKAKLPEIKAVTAIHQVVTPPSIFDKTVHQKLKIPFTRTSSRAKHGLARYVFQLPLALDSLHLLTLLQTSRDQRFFYRKHTRAIGQLAPGPYQVYLFDKTGNYLRHKIELRADSLYFHRFSEQTYTQDSTALLLRRMVKTNPQLDSLPHHFFNTIPIGQQEQEGLGQKITGQITDSNGEPLIGATVLIKGTTMGTVTDIDGRFSIWVPTTDYQLEFSYVGFTTKTVTPEALSNHVSISLEESSELLEEVVVTGYGISNLPTRKIQLKGRTAGLSVRGATTTAAGYYVDGLKIAGYTIGGEPDAPLIVLDAVQRTTAPDIDPEQIKSIEILQGQEAIDRYGEKGRNGVIIIETHNPDLFAPTADELRSDFRDYAFWQPHLITDGRGEAHFQVTFPDDITAWNSFAVGMDDRQRGGVGFAQTQAYKALSARLSLPRFLIAGDQVRVLGKAVYYGQDSVTVQTQFMESGQKISSKQVTISDAFLEEADVHAAPDQDSLTVSYSLRKGDYLDGETRSVAILPKGIRATEGEFFWLQGDTTVQIRPDAALGPVYLYAQANALEAMLDDLAYLKTYPYDCNEQVASKLMALVLEQSVRAALQQPFEQESAIRAAIRKLERSQHNHGAWGWWVNTPEQDWVTMHVTRALFMAKEAGYTSTALAKGLKHLQDQLPELRGSLKLRTLYLLAELGQSYDYAGSLPTINFAEQSRYDRLLAIRIRQMAKLPYSLEPFDTLRAKTLFGSLYWPSETHVLHQSDAMLSLLAYQIYRDAGQPEPAKRIRQYFLETRGQQSTPYGRVGWRNTLETAHILATILPDITNVQSGVLSTSHQLSIAGPEPKVITAFPYRDTLSAPIATTIHTQGDTPLFFTAYQNHYQPDPLPKNDLYVIQTTLRQQHQPVDVLQKGVPVTLEVTVQVKKAGEYVMIEVPIPAGCSYPSKPNTKSYPEIHRAYFRQHTAIFCEALPVGTFTFTIPLVPRFSGQYTQNPVRVEQMYFPVFNGNNSTKTVQIK